jgi:hypothetical protein
MDEIHLYRPLLPQSSLTPRACSCYAVPTSPYPPPSPSLTTPGTHKNGFPWPLHLTAGASEYKSLPFTKQVTGPQFLFRVKMAHALDPYNTPAANSLRLTIQVTAILQWGGLSKLSQQVMLLPYRQKIPT